jgi:hypothetical protein
MQYGALRRTLTEQFGQAHPLGVQATPSPFAVTFTDVAIRSVYIDLARCAVMNDMDGVNALEDIRQFKAKYCRSWN